MNLMFWKKKPAGDAAANEAVSGVFARIKARVVALVSRIKSPPPFKAEVAEGTDVPSAKAAPAGTKGASLPEDASAQPGKLARIRIALMSMTRVRMLIAGVVLLLLLLLAFGYAAWTIISSSPDPENDVAELIEDKHANDPPLPIVMPESAPAVVSDVSAASAPVDGDAVSAVPAAELHVEASSSVKAAPVSHVPQTEVEVLRQKNAELQTQLDALKKTQQPSSASVKLYPGDGKGAAAGGVATVGSSDPKAAATTLKEAIEAMNAGGNYQKKPAK
ncbi:MAG: hypothetical protein M0P59_04545 [Gallionella sp.]|jgi:hypothetical protein|nr:hypothetical protein [Gallionella sp.]MCK9353411.1 hypothetical protein [Gallionella sp.]